MASNHPNAVSIHTKKCSKDHPDKSHHHLYTQYPKRNYRFTHSTTTFLYNVGDDGYELVPTKFFSASEALAPASPERAFYS